MRHGKAALSQHVGVVQPKVALGNVALKQQGIGASGPRSLYSNILTISTEDPHNILLCIGTCGMRMIFRLRLKLFRRRKNSLSSLVPACCSMVTTSTSWKGTKKGSDGLLQSLALLSISNWPAMRECFMKLRIGRKISLQKVTTPSASGGFRNGLKTAQLRLQHARPQLRGLSNPTPQTCHPPRSNGKLIVPLLLLGHASKMGHLE
mmetsp:Transcript_103557/g.205837  ORF Transcript_103557/g.205837 Transcript_103557/m.205837 type:complete len:206 (+) Transcript_103557:411-1028(+)